MTESEMVLVNELMSMVSDLKKENSALTQLLLERAGILEKEEIVVVGESENKSAGKLPWYLRKQRLEKMYARKVSEAVRSDAGSDARLDNGDGDSQESSIGVCGEDSGKEA